MPERHIRGSLAPAPLTARGRRRATPPCPCGCGTQGFCPAHRERLATVRVELEQGGLRSVGNGRRRRVSPPRCCNPSCRQPRIPPAAFCEDCQAEGHTEEAAA